MAMRKRPATKTSPNASKTSPKRPPSSPKRARDVKKPATVDVKKPAAVDVKKPAAVTDVKTEAAVAVAQPSPSKTARLARAYNPAAYRVRLTSFKDFLHVLKARYMDTVFKATSLLLLAQLAYTALASTTPAAAAVAAGNESAVVALERIGSVPVAEACKLAYGELLWIAPTLIASIVSLLLRRGRSIYLVDFATFSPPQSWRVTHEQLLTTVRHIALHRAKLGLPFNDEDDIAFQAKVLANSGTGEGTAWPPGLVKCLEEGVAPTLTLADTRKEAEAILTAVLSDLFDRTGVSPKEVDFLIINCSLFSPTPSLCAMACNAFRFRSNLKTYNLSGQGCSASLLSVDLASELLRSNPNSLAVVVSTELITSAFYHGHEKGMLLQNTLFRSGGAAVMLTNKAARIGQARYRLRHLVRTQCADDDSYRAVYEQEDAEGNMGVALSKEIVKVAGNAMKINLTQLGPLILPLAEQLRVVASIVSKKLGLVGKDTPKYLPSFKSAIHFFCIHAGGRAVLDGIEKSLKLRPEDMEPSRSTLHKMGNTSSSSIWYELRHVEEHCDIRRGHKVLQLAFGSGFKCNSAVWTRLR